MNVLMLLSPKVNTAYLEDDFTVRQGLEKLAPTRALSGQTAGTRPHLSLSPQPPLWHLRPNLLTMVL